MSTEIRSNNKINEMINTKEIPPRNGNPLEVFKVADAVNADEAASKGQLDTKVSKSGDTLSGDLQLLTHNLKFNNGNYEVHCVLQGDDNFVIYAPFHTMAFGTTSNNSVVIDGGTIWHSSNDGSGSGLDADKLDGMEPIELPVSTAVQAKIDEVNAKINNGEW